MVLKCQLHLLYDIPYNLHEIANLICWCRHNICYISIINDRGSVLLYLVISLCYIW